ncbi:MAG: LuxR C-terminal-related transcriptional regulator [Methylovirgula sp.]
MTNASCSRAAVSAWLASGVEDEACSRACADRLGISRATARTHLSHIFSKTDARRQAELVRLLMQI